MKRKVFNRIICLLTTITMLATPFTSIADDLPEQGEEIELLEYGENDESSELDSDVLFGSEGEFYDPDEEAVVSEDPEDEDEYSPILNLDDNSLEAGDPLITEGISFEGDVEAQEGEEVPCEDSIYMHDVELGAGEEVFPDNSKSETIVPVSESLDAEMPDRSEFEGCQEITVGEIGQENYDLEIWGANTYMNISPSDLKVIRGCTGTVFIDIKNLIGNGTLYARIKGENLISPSWGKVDNSNGIRVPVYIKGEKNGIAEIWFDLVNPNTNTIICSTYLHITVYDGPKVYSSAAAVGLRQGQSYKATITVRGIYESAYVEFGNTNNNAIRCEWGGWNSSTGTIPLNITGISPGEGTVTVYLKSSAGGVTYSTVSIQVKVEGNPKVTVSVKETSLMAGGNESVRVSVANCNYDAYLICTTTNEAAYGLKWGEQNGMSVTLNINGKKAGSGTVYVYLKLRSNDQVLAQTSFRVNVFEPKMSFSSKDVSMDVGDEKTVNISVTGIVGTVQILFGISDSAICTCSWGEAANLTAPLKIQGLNSGSTYVYIYLNDQSGKTLCSESIRVSVRGKSYPKLIIDRSSVEVAIGDSVVVPISVADVSGSIGLSYETAPFGIFKCRWGDFYGNTCNLTITGANQGSGPVKINLYNNDTKEILASGQISVKVKEAEEIRISDISYKFKNFAGSASEKVCKYMFNDISWRSIYNANIGGKGNCFGMAVTDGLFYNLTNNVDVSSFAPLKNKIGELDEWDKSDKFDLTVHEFIQAMQISQAASMCRNVPVDDLDKMIQKIDLQKKSGMLVVLSIKGVYNGEESGHSIVAFGTQRLNSSTSRILVYDNNYPNEIRYLTVSRDSNGKATKWSYELTKGCVWGGELSDEKLFYLDYNTYLNLWSFRGGLSNVRSNLMAINSQDFTVYDVYDYPVAVMENGVFTSENENIYKVECYEFLLNDDQTGSEYSLIYLPVDFYTIKNTDKSIDELDLTFTNQEYGVEVTTKADEVMLCADDNCDLAAAMLNECDQKEYSISLLKSDDKGELQTIEISGVGQANVVSAALDSGNLETSNVEGSNIVISDGAGFDKKVSDITLDKYYKEIIEGDKFTINAIVTPVDAVDAQIQWSSSDETIAKVDENGCVEAVSAGYATIVAKAGDIETVCTVNVIEKGSQPLPADPVLIKSISFNEAEVSLKPGQSKQLDVTINPEDATNKKLTWSSDNESVVTVSDNGVITAVSEGQATITVTAEDSGKAKASCVITVSATVSGGSATDPQPYIDETTTELTLVKGQKFVLSEKDWKSSDNKVVNVKNGKVTVKKDGTAQLSREGQTINVTVLAPSFAAKSVKMISGEEKSIVLNNTGDLDVLYLSAAPDVAAVDEEGGVTALSKGSAVINAYVNGVTYKYSVKVADADTSKRDFTKTVELSPMQTVSIKLNGFNAKKASWSSDSQVSENEIPKGCVFADSVVKISGSGKLTAIGAGETTLTATGGSASDVTIKVVVAEPVEKTLHINVNSSKPIKLYGVKGNPDWNVEDDAIVSVDKNKVTAKAAGSTELTAQYEGFTYKVTVYAEDITLTAEGGLTGKSNKYSISMKTGDTVELLPAKLYQPLILKSNKSEIAYADEDGVLIARSAGTAKLTAKVNGKTITVTVKVTE